MKRGTIILTPFPFTDLKGEKVRPSIIISSDTLKNEDVIVAFISSVIPIENTPETDFIIDSKNIFFRETGLKVTSAIKTNKIATISRKIILGELGYLNTDFIPILNNKLKLSLGIE